MTLSGQSPRRKPVIRSVRKAKANRVATSTTMPEKMRKLGSAISAYHEEVLNQNEQLRETQIELEKSRDRYARLYDEAPVGYMTLDRSGVVLKANLTALKLLQAERDLIVHRPLLVFLHHEDRSAFLNFLLVSRGNPGDQKTWVEVRLRKAIGGYAHVQLSSVEVAGESVRGTVILVALTDVSGRVFAEEERRKNADQIADALRQRAAAQAASEAKDRFLAMLSHELRTPLSPAVLILSAMAESPNISPEMREDLASVLSNLELEVRLIDDLLDLSRMFGGKFAPKFEHIDLRDVIRNAVEICRPEFQHRDVVMSPTICRRAAPGVRGSNTASTGYLERVAQRPEIHAGRRGDSDQRGGEQGFDPGPNQGQRDWNRGGGAASDIWHIRAGKLEHDAALRRAGAGAGYLKSHPGSSLWHDRGPQRGPGPGINVHSGASA